MLLLFNNILLCFLEALTFKKEVTIKFYQRHCWFRDSVFVNADLCMLGLVLTGVVCSQILLKSFGIIFFIVWKRIKFRPSSAVCFLKNNIKNQKWRSEMCRVFYLQISKTCSTVVFFNSLSILCLLFLPPSFMVTLCTHIFFSCISMLSGLGCFLLSYLSCFFSAEHWASKGK